MKKNIKGGNYKKDKAVKQSIILVHDNYFKIILNSKFHRNNIMSSSMNCVSIQYGFFLNYHIYQARFMHIFCFNLYVYDTFHMHLYPIIFNIEIIIIHFKID